LIRVPSRARARRWVKSHQTVALGVLFVILAATLGYSFLGNVSAGPVTVVAGTLQQRPTFPGQNLPNVYFTISYEGLGIGSFSYMVSYNTTGGGVYSNSGSVFVRQGSPYSYYLYVAPSRQGASAVSIEVYRGQSVVSANLVYQKTLSV
jgi:hypothetical protein